MREIKFRAWNRHNEKFRYFDLFEINKGLLCSIDEEDDIPQQYTGLKDKNGVEIYEGDILSSNRNWPKRTEIRWAKAYSGEQWCEFEIRDCNGKDVKSDEPVDFYGGVSSGYQEVIGNIFEGVKL